MLAKITAYLKPSVIFSYLLIPTALMALYCGAFAFFSARLLPENVNYYFTFKLFKVLLILLAGVGLLLVLPFVSHRTDRAPLIRRSNPALSAADFLLLLLPLTPVAQFVTKNQSMLTPLDTFLVLGFFVLLAGISILLIPWLLGRFSAPGLLMMLGLAFVFTITSMSSISQYFHWLKQGTLSKQALFLGLVFCLSWVLYLPKTRKWFYLLIALSFVVNSATVVLAGGSQPVETKASGVTLGFQKSAASQKTPLTTPNIYLLVYDAYAHNETMQAYGIDNSAQEKFLLQQGFVLYPHTYSIGGSTIETMSSVLDVPFGTRQAQRQALSGNGSVHNIMKYLGYQTYGIFPYDYMFRGTSSKYDISFPLPRKTYPRLISAILMGEFRFDIGFDDISHEDYATQKHSVLQAPANGRVFLYSHSNLPNHAQSSGKCLPGETQQYKSKLEQANLEMRQDVEILAQHDPQAIIIVAGDHGPHLTKNCSATQNFYVKSEITRLDIQDRFGSFLAIRWPTQDYGKYDDIRIIQDVFPAVLAYMYKDTSLLDTRIDMLIDKSHMISGVSVRDGIIEGGADDGEPLFLSTP